MSSTKRTQHPTYNLSTAVATVAEVATGAAEAATEAAEAATEAAEAATEAAEAVAAAGAVGVVAAVSPGGCGGAIDIARPSLRHPANHVLFCSLAARLGPTSSIRNARRAWLLHVALIISFVDQPVLAEDVCDARSTKGDICLCKLSDLHPTQASVGMAGVRIKTAKR
jgi:hypothetical protein